MVIMDWQLVIKNMEQKISTLHCQDSQPDLCGVGGMGCSNCMAKHYLNNIIHSIKYNLQRNLDPLTAVPEEYRALYVHK